MGDEVDFLPANKHKSFLQVDSITLGVHSQACPKYPKNKFAISLQYLKKNRKDEVEFLSPDKHKIFFQFGTLNLGVYGQACPNYPKQEVCYLVAIS